MTYSLKMSQTYMKYYNMDRKQYAGHKFWGLTNFKQKEKTEKMENNVAIKNLTSNSQELGGGGRKEREREKMTQIIRSYHSLGHADIAKRNEYK